jgi:cytochrome P450 family 20 subfamily A
MEQRLHIGPPEPGSQRDKNFHDCLDFVKSKILQIVRDRNDGVGDDEIPFVDALLKSRVSDDQIFADCLSFMVGGFHTSGYLLVWSIYYLSSHPDIFAKLLDEMKDRVGANQTHKLKDYVYSTNTYLRQILDETLRFSTLAPYAARYSDHDTVIGGYSVPAGTPIIQALGVALKNECTWENVDV